MLVLLASCLALQAPLIQPPRLRTILGNGAVVLIERDASSKQLSVQLFVSAQDSPETPSTHGLRHLMEHLEAPGRDGTLDRRVEARGGFITAQTLRDATVFSLSLRPSDLEFGLRSMSEIMELGPVGHDDISREAAIIRQEQALERSPEKLSEAAWEAAYGDQGLDPSGNPDVIAAATPEQVAKLHRDSFQGRNLVLVIKGDVDLDAATAAGSEILKSSPSGPPPVFKMREGHAGKASADTAGEARGALVTDFNSVQTAARLAAALGIASELEGAFVTYTPSQRGGLILIGISGGAQDLAQRIDKIVPARIEAIGRTLALRWVDRQIGSASNGFMRGLLLVQGAGVQPETMIQNLKDMRSDDFAKGFQAFRSPNAVEVPGR
jgi:predicted Zn-dependent peptidase